MKLKVNVQLASWATWNEFQGVHFFELKVRGPNIYLSKQLIHSDEA